MTTSPILAEPADTRPLRPGSTCPNQSPTADKSDFHQVLRRVNSGENSSNCYSAASVSPRDPLSTSKETACGPGTLPNAAKSATQERSSGTYILSDSSAADLKVDISVDPKAGKQKTGDKTLSVNTKLKITEKDEKTDSASTPDIPQPALSILVPISTPVEASLLASPRTAVGFFAAPQELSSARQTSALADETTLFASAPIALSVSATIFPRSAEAALANPESISTSASSAFIPPSSEDTFAGTPSSADAPAEIASAVAVSTPGVASSPAINALHIAIPVGVTPLSAANFLSATNRTDAADPAAVAIGGRAGDGLSPSASVGPSVVKTSVVKTSAVKTSAPQTPVQEQTVFPALKLEPTLRTANSMAATKAKARPFNGTATGKSNAVTPAPDNANDAASVFETTQHVPGLHTPGTWNASVDGNSSVSHSEFPSVADSAPSETATDNGYTWSQPVFAQDSELAAQDKSAESVEHDSTAMAVASAVSGHPSSAQPASLQPTPSPSPSSATTEIMQSAAMLPQTLPGSAPIAARVRPQIQSISIPDPPRMVDSGKLQVNQNNSELKISVQLPELGKIEVRAVTAHDVTTAHVTAFQHDALQLLATALPGLEQVLKSHDVILGSLDAHAQDAQAQGQSASQQRQPESHNPTQFHGGMPSIAAEITTSSMAEGALPGYMPDHASISVRA